MTLRALQSIAAVVLAVAVVVVVLLVVLSDLHALIVLVALILVVAVLNAVRSERHSRELTSRSVQQGTLLTNLSAKGDSDLVVETAATIEELRKGLVNRHRKGPLRLITKTTEHLYEQVQATINLFAMVDVTAPVPPLRGWAVSPDALNLLIQEFLAIKPRLVVECGSGSSTLFLGLVAKKFNIQTRVVALDHDPVYAAKTNQLLAAHGVDDIASARLAPLTDVTTDRGPQPWYDPAALADLTDIGLLFVDGPPALSSTLARYPALPMLGDSLAARVSIVLDDTDRADETEIIALWKQMHPELVGENVETEKGTYILRRP